MCYNMLNIIKMVQGANLTIKFVFNHVKKV